MSRVTPSPPASRELAWGPQVGAGPEDCPAGKGAPVGLGQGPPASEGGPARSRWVGASQNPEEGKHSALHTRGGPWALQQGTAQDAGHTTGAQGFRDVARRGSVDLAKPLCSHPVSGAPFPGSHAPLPSGWCRRRRRGAGEGRRAPAGSEPGRQAPPPRHGAGRPSASAGAGWPRLCPGLEKRACPRNCEDKMQP